MLLRRIRAQAVALSVIPLGFLVLLLVLAIVLQQQAQDTAAWSQHSGVVLNESDNITKILDAANTGVVQFVTTHNPQGLQRYRTAAANMPAHLRALQALVTDNPAQETRARVYSSEVLQALDVLRRYLALNESGNKTAAQALDASPSTRRLAEALGQGKNDFDSAERTIGIGRFARMRRQMGMFTAVVISVTVLGILVTLFTTARFGLRLAERLERLAENALVLGEGGSPAPIGGNDEIADLDRAYQAMARRLRQEHRIASTLQQALLPQETPEVSGLEISTAYSPAAEGTDIGGDWYDAFPLDDKVLALSVGDVAGSGLQAATIMGAVRQAMRTVAREHADPADVLRIVNQMVCAEGWLVSGFFGTLDVGARRLKYSSAGHPPPLLALEGEVRTLEAEGLILGVDPTAEFQTTEIVMPDGALLVLYTDGLIEAERDLLRGAERLRRILSDRSVRESGEPAREIQTRVFENIVPRDDSAVLTVRSARVAAVRPQQSAWTFDPTDPGAARRVRAEMVRFIAGHAPHTDPTTAELVFGELAGNVAKHSPGSARFTVERRDGTVVLRMSSKGMPFAYRYHGVDPLAEDGRGLFLVHTLAQEMAIDREESSNVVSVVLKL